ncbi:MAG TPA: YihY/virulence factor BrkB family protein [Pseudolabrys sp.]|jgi:membrane protein|nr:YihY/virulence factor BrkB family protein [Pseudolabrys sp.]
MTTTVEAGIATVSASARRLPRSWTAWKHVLYRTYEEIVDDRLLALAAGVVFYGLLALFPAITALVSSYALFADPATIGKHLALIASVMPQSAYSVVNDQVLRIVTGATGKLGVAFFFGLALALWSANAGVKAIIDALNIAYGVRERRGFIKLNLVSLAFTAGAVAAMLLAIAGVVVLPVVLSYLPFGGHGTSVMAWLRWPVLFVLLLIGLALLYRFGPDLEHPRWRWISPGAALAALAWLAGSALLSWYLARFAHYDATYGSLGAAIGLMMWLWMTAIVVLAGAELNSEIDAQDEAAHAPFPQKKK